MPLGATNLMSISLIRVIKPCILGMRTEDTCEVALTGTVMGDSTSVLALFDPT